MANPRATIDFEGLNGQYATYTIDNSTITYDVTKANGSAQVGLAVTLSGNGTVALADIGNPVEGKLISVEADNRCTVQYAGFMKLPGGASATLTVGTKIVGAQGAASAKGYIKTATASGAAYAEAAADDTQAARGTIIDPSTTTAVVVRL
jgi:hypothetical protein